MRVPEFLKTAVESLKAITPWQMAAGCIVMLIIVGIILDREMRKEALKEEK